MSVHVTLLPTALPVGAEGSDRTISYEDRPKGNPPSIYRYSLHDSGSLVVWCIPDDGMTEMEVTYGPSAWESVQGDKLRSAR